MGLIDGDMSIGYFDAFRTLVGTLVALVAFKIDQILNVSNVALSSEHGFPMWSRSLHELSGNVVYPGADAGQL
jgi:hypothetical protein